MIRWLRAWGPALACAALLFLASSRPTVPVPLPGNTDKVAHFGAYSVFGFALGHARRVTGIPLAAAALLGGLYALSDEVHQGFVPGRAPEFGDWLADAAGVLAGLAAYQLWHRLWTGRSGRAGDSRTSTHT